MKTSLNYNACIAVQSKVLKKNITIHLAKETYGKFKLYVFQACKLDVVLAKLKKTRNNAQYAEIKVECQCGIGYVCIMSSSCIIDWLCCLEVQG